MSDLQQHEVDDNDDTTTTEKRRRGRPKADRSGSETVKRQRIRSTPSRNSQPVTEESIVLSPKPKRRTKLNVYKSLQGDSADDTSISADSVHDANVEMQLQTIISELSKPDISSERRDIILKTISTDKFLKKYSDRSLLLKKLVQNQMDHELLILQPVPESVSVFFQRLFASINKTPPAKTKVLDQLFEQINDCLAEDKDHLAELTNVLTNNETSIASFGAYMVTMLRLAALRQLESNGFDAFDTLCYLIEVLRQCVSAGLTTTLALVADEESFSYTVNTTEAAQVQLAFSLSKYGLSLPKAP